MENERKMGRQGEHVRDDMTPAEEKLLGTIFDKREESEEEAERASNRLVKELVDDVLACLPPEEKRVLQLRFGLPDGISRTLKEVGKEMGFSATTAWRREREALKKMNKQSPAKKRLRDYLE